LGINVIEFRDEKSPSLITRAENLIAFLNEKTGRRFPARNPRGAPTANADVVMARLREGYTDQDCRSIVMLKVRQWGHDERMVKYLTPETLFRRSNFERYLGELGDE
jgi:uncharacterized phage protein (TIGR02220 family)